jgi:hypothetical protein
MRGVASQGGGGSCGILGFFVLTDGDLRCGSIAQRAGWKPFAAQDKPALPVIAGSTRYSGKLQCGDNFSCFAADHLAYDLWVWKT